MLLERGDEVARLHVVAAEAEDRRRQPGLRRHCGDAVVALLGGVLRRPEQRLGDQAGQGGLVRALQHGDRLRAGSSRHEFGLGERLQQLDGHDARPSVRARAGTGSTARTSSVTEPRPTMT
ncbi:MAG: hypothetical protein V9G10_12990 [Candidatus Nanopelagicales bacterium]